MPFPVSTFADLNAQIAGDFQAIPGLDPTIRMGVLPVLQKVLAKLAAAELAYLAALPDRALLPDSVASSYLDRWAGSVGLSRLAATPSVGSVQFSGQVGLPIPSGTQLQDSTGTITLATTADATIATGSTTVNAQVITVTAGSTTNLVTNAPVTLLVGIAGVLATAVVLAPGLTGGTDQETDAALHVRLQARLSNPPQGGASADYVTWAQLVNGVTRVWVYPLQGGPGTVWITFTMDGRTNPIPLPADVAAVQSSINARAPVVGISTVFAATGVTNAVTIASLVAAPGYTLALAQANATAAVAALNYVTIPGGTLYLEQVNAAIANAPGVGTYDLTAPTADINCTFGQLIQLSAPAFT
jgi:uncharacterized phage protein gp47/JayE